MSPETRQPYGLPVLYENEGLGIPLTKNSLLCHFFPDETRIRVEAQMDYEGHPPRKGWLIGKVDKIGTCDEVMNIVKTDDSIILSWVKDRDIKRI